MEVLLDAVSRSYDESEVLREVSLAMGSGESLAIVGPSGSGKSTLLNLIGTLDQPSTGSVSLGGNPIAGLSEQALSDLRASRIGFIFQLHHLLPQLSVLENVLLPTLAPKDKPKDAAERAHELLKRVGLADHHRSRPGQLSGGERQRTAVVRALINAPELILADEPTGALDDDNAKNLIDLLLELNQEEKTSLVMVTHNEKLANRLGRVLRLEKGQLISDS